MINFRWKYPVYALPPTRTLLSSLMSTATTMFLLASVSAFLYATFYYAYMPVEMVNMPVHLQFQPCEGQTANR